jgi:hypothetical protein
MTEPIYEAVVTTCSAAGVAHVAPMGVRYRPQQQLVLMPFRPSTTLDNILATGQAVLNLLTDVRVFAGCVTGRKTWPMVGVAPGAQRLACAQGHEVLTLLQADAHPQRPTLLLQRGPREVHAPYDGCNRAQAAVLEAAVLVSRLHLLPADKVDAEWRYLQIAIDKTAGEPEREAWGWLQQALERHRAQAGPAVGAA